MNKKTTAFVTYSIFLLFVFYLVSCSSSDNSESILIQNSSRENPTETSDSIIGEPYPGSISPTQPQREPYPIPATEEFTIASIPTPVADLATVTGVLMRRSTTSSSEPASKVLLALAKVVEGPNGEPMVVSFSQLSAPRALTDSTGRFVFVDVPPGQYGLIYDRISDAFLLNDPETGGDYLFFVEASQILDLGELIYTNLPDKKN